MVRVVRLERTVSWSQTRRDTNFAIPGYSLFCHDTTARGKNKDFSVCGHLCGQSRFCAVFGNRGKTRYCPCRKALRRFALPCPGYRHGTPKAGALPVALHPDIRFSYSAVVVKHVVKGPCSRKLRGRGSAGTPVITGDCGISDFDRVPGVLHAPKAGALPAALHPEILHTVLYPIFTAHARLC